MDWERARSTLYHAGTGEPMTKKNVGYKTQLSLLGHDDPFDIGLFVYDHGPIITWHRNGSLTLDNKNYWSTTTKDRLRAFLPQGFAVVQDRPFWFLHTPSGPRPWQNGMTVDKYGAAVDMPDPLNRYNARQLRHEVEEYAKDFVVQLLRGNIPFTATSATLACAACLDNAVAAPVRGGAHGTLAMFHHVQHKDLDPYLLLAAIQQVEQMGPGMHQKGYGYLGRDELRDIVFFCGSPGYPLSRKPRTKRELVEHTELRMTLPDHLLPNSKRRNPRSYAPNLRRILSDYILRPLGFEWMQ